MIRSFLSVGGLTMISRVLGLIRDLFMARYLGAGLAADAFIIAFKLPNFFRRLFAEGAFSAAFVPLIAKKLAGPDGEREAQRFASEALAMLFAGLLALTLLAEIFMPWVIWALTGAGTNTPDKALLATQLTRLTFPYLLLISLVALFSGVLNAKGRFAAAAGAPILLNLSLISALLFFHDGPAGTAFALAAAVSIGGLLQLILLLLGVWRQGFLPTIRVPKLTAGVRRLLIIMGPAALGAGAVQVNLLVDILLASRFLPEGALSYLYYADRLNQLPLGVVGIAVSTVLLPQIASAVSAADKGLAHRQLNRGLDFALLITLPAALALIAVPDTLLRPLYQHGAFLPSDTQQTAMALWAYALGLPAYMLVKVLTAAFFAQQDTATPMRLSLIALGVNLVGNLLLIWPLAHGGLALATALAAWVNAVMLAALLYRRGWFRPDRQLVVRLARMGLASALMVATILPAANLFPDTGTKQEQILALLVVLLAGLISYGVATVMLGLITATDIKRLRRRA